MATISAQYGLPAEKPRSGRRTVLVAATTALFLAFPLVVTAAVVPKFEEIFKDFGVALPVLARLFIQLGRLLSSPLGWAVTIGAILLVIVPVSALASRKGRWAWLLLVLAAVLDVLYLVLLVVGMFVPLTAMIESLQQSGTP